MAFVGLSFSYESYYQAIRRCWRFGQKREVHVHVACADTEESIWQTVSRKAEWPDWHPPAQMIARQPYLPRFMAGGPGNPLGARAMYLGSSEYRIHGTNQPQTIGTAVSSGCLC